MLGTAVHSNWELTTAANASRVAETMETKAGQNSALPSHDPHTQQKLAWHRVENANKAATVCISKVSRDLVTLCKSTVRNLKRASKH